MRRYAGRATQPAVRGAATGPSTVWSRSSREHAAGGVVPVGRDVQRDQRRRDDAERLVDRARS